MASSKNLNVRIQHKHDTHEYWTTGAGKDDIPLYGELIIYDPDDTCAYTRLKFGDGKTNVVDLPFFGNEIVTRLDEVENIQANTVPIFVGTTAQYNEADSAGTIAIGTLVFITDDSSSGGGVQTNTSAELGEAIIGYMVLGNPN